MRIWQARFVGPVTIGVAGVFLAISPGIAQQGGRGGGGASTPTAPGGGTTTPTPSPIPTPRPTQPQTQPQTDTTQPRPIWISGRVMMYDGVPPPESVTIERICGANSVHAEGYTDSKGGFSFNLGQSNNGVFADASTSIFDQPGQQVQAEWMIGIRCAGSFDFGARGFDLFFFGEEGVGIGGRERCKFFFKASWLEFAVMGFEYMWAQARGH